MRVLAVLALLITGCSTFVYMTDEALNMRRLVAKSVVRSLNVTKQSVATGFIIMVRDKKIMVSNFHHCGYPPVEMEALSEQTKETYPLNPIVAFPLIDICLAEIIGAEALPPLKLAPDNPELGTTVFTMGFPHGQWLRLMTGQVEHYDLEETPPQMQTNMWVIGGQSGSPVLNKNREVVGVMYATNRSDHLGMAIPLTYLKEAIKALEQELDKGSDPAGN